MDTTVTVQTQDRVRDRVSGLEGTAVEKVTFQNGCVYFIVQPDVHKSGDMKGLAPKPSVVSHLVLDVIKPAAAKKPEEKVKETRTGGPARSMKDLMGR